MYNLFKHYPDLQIPLKKDLPCLNYDFSLFCKTLKESYFIPMPTYLNNFEQFLDFYSAKLSDYHIDIFPAEYRIYIIDNRLNLLFATLDSTGKIAHFCSKYRKESFTMECYSYGDNPFKNITLNTPDNIIDWSAIIKRLTAYYSF